MELVLVTNGGPHPSDKWAALAAQQVVTLIQIDDVSDSAEASAARKAKPRLEIAISDAIENAFVDAMSSEQSSVHSGETTSRNAPFQIDRFVDSAVIGTLAATVGTPFENHFAIQYVQTIVRNILSQNIIDAANIQRSWAFDEKGL